LLTLDRLQAVELVRRNTSVAPAAITAALENDKLID
jgi:hypothetical protein